MNQKPAIVQSEIAAAFLSGKSVREVSQELGCSKGTVLRYRHRLLQSGVSLPTCGCGRESGHKGMCRPRLQKCSERSVAEPGNASAGVPMSQISDEILRVLAQADKPLTASEIFDVGAFDEDVKPVYAALPKMVTDGLIFRISPVAVNGGGKYSYAHNPAWKGTVAATIEAAVASSNKVTNTFQPHTNSANTTDGDELKVKATPPELLKPAIEIPIFGSSAPKKVPCPHCGKPMGWLSDMCLDCYRKGKSVLKYAPKEVKGEPKLIAAPQPVQDGTAVPSHEGHAGEAALPEVDTAYNPVSDYVSYTDNKLMQACLAERDTLVKRLAVLDKRLAILAEWAEEDRIGS